MPPILRSGRGLRPRPQPQSASEDSASPRPALTPIYQRERSVTEVTLKPQGARTLRDQLIAHLNDGKYHSAYELQHLSFLKSSGNWYTLIGEAIEYGYSFGRLGNSLIMRPRSLVDKPQDLSELFAGIDSASPEDVNHLYDSSANRARPQVPKYRGEGGSEAPEGSPGDGEGKSEDGPGFSMDSSDTVPLPRDEDRLIISIDPGGCPLSGRSSLTSTRAILAKKNSGKTYLGMVIAEEFSRLNIPFAVIDPTGVWYGLCALIDGTASSYPLIRIGGTHGHFAITFEQGALVADVVAANGYQSFILDVSDMMPEEQHQFVADFGIRLYTINKRARHLFVDEADEFCPQSVSNSYMHQKRALGAFDRIVRRGRVKGIGTTLITQRPAVIHKNLLSQVDGIFVMHVVAPHDLEAVEAWMKPVVPMSMRNDCLSALPKLQQGEAFFMQSGADTTPLVRFMTKKKTTFDSSKTPTLGDPEPTPALSSPDRDVLSKVALDLGLKVPPKEDYACLVCGAGPMDPCDGLHGAGRTGEEEKTCEHGVHRNLRCYTCEPG